MCLRDRERGTIAALKQILAPIRKFPAELLVEIFRVVAAQAGKLSRSDCTSCELMPVLALSQVCGHWRRLVCTTPQLWNYQVDLNLNKMHSDTYLAATKTFFERSAPLPIPILWRGQTREASPLVQLPLDVAPRWGSLVFADSDISHLYKLPMDALKNLSSVDLDHMPEISSSSPLTVFLGAHSLRWVNIQVPKITNRIHMPWSQLVVLSLHVFGSEPAQDFLDVLAECTNAVSVEFGGIVPWSEPLNIGSAPVVRLARLTTLALGFNPGEVVGYISSFIARLALPSLTKLSIASCFKTYWSSPDLTAFLRRSPNIEDWTMKCSFMNSDNLASLLLDSPSLVTLDLRECFLGDEAFESTLECLTFSAAALVHPAPRLQQITMTGNMQNIDEAKLERMVSSRWWTDAQLAALTVAPPVARWKKVDISTDFDHLHEDRQGYSGRFRLKMTELRAQGLHVRIH